MAGGRGGGIIHLNVRDFLHVEGKISANGKDATNVGYSGGGAGGSIYITTNTLEGAGTLEVGSFPIHAGVFLPWE